MIELPKEQHFFFNIINDLTVSCDQLNASLLKKSINVLIKSLTDPSTAVVYNLNYKYSLLSHVILHTDFAFETNALQTNPLVSNESLNYRVSWVFIHILHTALELQY